MATTQILNATSGNSAEFRSADNRIRFRLSINGVANNNIEAFVDDGKDIFNGSIILKIKGLTGSGTTINLQGKTLDSDDSDFDDTGRIFSKDYMGYYHDFRAK